MSSRLFRGDVERRITPIAWILPSGDQGETETRRQHSTEDESGPIQEDRVRDVETELAQTARESYEKGFQEGREAARQEFEPEVKPLQQRLTEIVASVSDLRARIQQESELELVKLATAIAQRILHREITLDPEAVQGLARVALDRVGSRELLRVRVHPAQKRFVEPVVEQACQGRNVELIADSKLRSGDMLFETERGDLDASVDSQLEEIRRGLADRLGG